MGKVLGEHGLADAAGADEDDVDMLAEEVEIEEGLDRVVVDLPGMRPVEVGERLEGAKRRMGDPTLEATTAALGLLGFDQRSEPGSPSTACQRARRPCNPSAAARSRRFASGVLRIVALLGRVVSVQRVVCAQVMRLHDDGAQTFGQLGPAGLDRGPEALARVAERGDVEEVA